MMASIRTSALSLPAACLNAETCSTYSTTSGRKVLGLRASLPNWLFGYGEVVPKTFLLRGVKNLRQVACKHQIITPTQLPPDFRDKNACRREKWT